MIGLHTNTYTNTVTVMYSLIENRLAKALSCLYIVFLLQHNGLKCETIVLELRHFFLPLIPRISTFLSQLVHYCGCPFFDSRVVGSSVDVRQQLSVADSTFPASKSIGT